ncbi:hypothetical protein [Polaromonas sp. DSR2-3-2]|uniref:hypothetical protein n=1 Tax=unclassified Polaromonas TaxID=2638319 RepID=UPI003CEC01F9
MTADIHLTAPKKTSTHEILHIADHRAAVFFGRHFGQQVEPADDLAEFALKAQVGFSVQFQQAGNGYRDLVVVATITLWSSPSIH